MALLSCGCSERLTFSSVQIGDERRTVSPLFLSFVFYLFFFFFVYSLEARFTVHLYSSAYMPLHLSLAASTPFTMRAMHAPPWRICIIGVDPNFCVLQ
jgi:hypothetical protein